MTLHDILTLFGWTSITSADDIMERSYISQRTRTVTKLSALLEKQRVVLVRGTPASGKTTLGKLLRAYYNRTKIKGRIIPVVFFNSWERDGIDYDVKIRNEGLKRYPEFQNWDFVDEGEYLLILDEGQMTYTERGLWYGLVKNQSNQNTHETNGSSGPRVLILASYGSPGAGPDSNLSEGSPLANLTAAQRVSITKSSIEGSPELSLFYDEEELSDVVMRFTQEAPKLRLTENAKRRVYDLTNGHPGAVFAVLSMLLETYRSDLKYKGLELGEERVQLAINNQEAMNIVWRAGFRRSLPKDSSEEATITLRKVLAEGFVARDLDDPGIKTCYQKGWLHSEPRDAECNDIVCVFPTVLHAMYVERKFTSYLRPFPLERYPTIQDLGQAILSNFSMRNLSNRSHLMIGPAAIPRNPEAVYQVEFHRAAAAVLGYSMDLQTEWSPDGNGRIDFCFGETKWGFELLRDGDRLNEHTLRFIKGGMYWPWIKDGHLLDWLIIDCRTSQPYRYHGDDPSPKLWRAVFRNSYSSLEILDAKNEIIGRFVLTNDP